MNIHYAVQVCDIANNQVDDRYCKTDRTTLSKKSIASLMQAIKYVSLGKETSFVHHYITFFDDSSSQVLKEFLVQTRKKFEAFNIHINTIELQEHGVMQSIGACYKHLMENGTDLVYQVQDDYLFCESSIYEMVDMYLSIQKECETDPIVMAYNDSKNWLDSYRNRPTPRTLFYGANRHWIQMYDTSCTFMTSVQQLRNNKDLIDIFLSLPPKGTENGQLESISLNYMFTRKGILGVAPLLSVALHVQSETDKDPYVDWKKIWDSVEVY